MSNSTTVCIDAGIVVRLTLGLDDTGIKQRWDSWISQGDTLVSPALLYYEVTNALYRQGKSGLLTPEFIRDALDFALGLPIKLISDAGLHQRARALALEYNLAATYDAHYLAVAEQFGAQLWTTDARLVKAVQPFGVDWVKLPYIV